jgi:hypothetical protein
MLLLKLLSLDARPISRVMDSVIALSLPLSSSTRLSGRFSAPRRKRDYIFLLSPPVLISSSSEPYTEESYGGFLGAPAISVDGATYNSTDGFFCVTSVLSQLSAYFGTDLTVPFITGAVSGDNTTAVDLATSIQPNIICNDCIFAAFDLIAEAYPSAGNVTFDTIFGALNMTSPLPAGTTLLEAADGTCAYQNQSISTGESTCPSAVQCD